VAEPVNFASARIGNRQLIGNVDLWIFENIVGVTMDRIVDYRDID
jgi:hypothetical protein